MNHSRKNQQRQIDCTDHDSVITSLQMKSKDLYYFWRNYEWLYNHYYSQPEEQKPSRQQLQIQVNKLEIENARLRTQNESLKKQLSVQMVSQKGKIEQEYQREIDRLNNKCRDYEAIREKMSEEITVLKDSLHSYRNQMQATHQSYAQEVKKKERTIIQLEKNIDQLREKAMNHRGSSYEKYQREVHKMKVMMSSLQTQVNGVMQEEFEQMRSALLQEFPSLFQHLSSTDLSQLLQTYSSS